MMISKTCVFSKETLDGIYEAMKSIGEDPGARGNLSRYIEDAIMLKNGLVKSGKWIPADMVNFNSSKIAEKKGEGK